MKFDVVVGNPPFQESREDTRDDSIYNYFYDLAEKIAPQYILISPARFLFNAGSTDKRWNKKMLNDEHIKVVYFEQDSSLVFSNTDIKGGVCIIHRNEEKNFGKIGTFTIYPELNSILHKVIVKGPETLDKFITGQGIYRFTKKMHEENPEVKSMLSINHPNDVGTSALEILDNIIIFKNRPEDGKDYIQILGRYNKERVYHWIRKDYINEPKCHHKYKVIISKANGSGKLGEFLSSPIIGIPNVAFTQTFISIGEFDDSLEAKNLQKYLNTKFLRLMLGILKITQDNPASKWKYVPWQDFSDNSDVDWSDSIENIDNYLFKKYNFDKHEIDFIHSIIEY